MGACVYVCMGVCVYACMCMCVCECICALPRNSSEIRALAQQMTPGNLILVGIYLEAIRWPFSYLFTNLTQQCSPSVKYLSNLFNGIQAYIPIGKTFRKIGGNGNFKSMIFGGNIPQKTLVLFKPPQNFTMKKHRYNDGMMIEPNEQFAHNNQNNPTLHPPNYTNTQNHPTPHPMNYNFNQQHQYDVAKQNPSNYTQTNINPMKYNFNQQHQYDVAKQNPPIYTHTDINPMNYNFNQQHQYDVAKQNLSNYTQTDTKPFIANSTQTYPLDLSSKYTNTHTPNENYSSSDPIHQSGKYTNTQIQQNNHTQTSEQSYPDRDLGIITPFYQSNYARSLQNVPIESMQTCQYNRLPIQSEQP